MIQSSSAAQGAPAAPGTLHDGDGTSTTALAGGKALLGTYRRLVCGPLLPIAAFSVLANFVVALSGTIRLPFIRSLIVCEGEFNKSITPDDVLWSGSEYCPDKLYVVGEALAVGGVLDGLRLGLRVLSLPILGALMDSAFFGRRRAFILGMIGTIAAAFLCAFAVPIPYGVRVPADLGIAYAIQGLLVEFGATVNAQIADRTHLDDRSHAFTIMTFVALWAAGIGNFVSIGIQRMFLTNYDTFWYVLAGFDVLGLLLVIALLPETRPENYGGNRESDGVMIHTRGSIKWRVLQIARDLRFLSRDLFLFTSCIGIFLTLTGYSMWGTLSSSTIAVLNFQQSTAAIIVFLIGPLFMLVLALSPRLIKRYGAHRVFIFGNISGIVCSGLFAASFAIPSSVLFVISCICCAPIFVVFPTLNVILSSKYHDAGDHGKAQSIIAMSGALGAAVGLTFSGTVVYQKSATSGVYAALPMIVCIIFTSCGTVCLELGLRKFYKSSQGGSEEEEGIDGPMDTREALSMELVDPVIHTDSPPR